MDIDRYDIEIQLPRVPPGEEAVRDGGNPARAC